MPFAHQLATVILSAALAWPAVAGEAITGPARVIDGDPLFVAGQEIRLYGIDAPECNQTCAWPGKTIPCGRLATLALMDLTVVCYDPDGFDIVRNMVHTGWALAYRRYSTDYVDTEDDAREAKRGMWKGEFVPPWEWRRGRR